MSLLNDLDKQKWKIYIKEIIIKIQKINIIKYHMFLNIFFRKKVWRMHKIHTSQKGDFIKYDFQFLSFNKDQWEGDYTKVVVDIQELRIAKEELIFML